MAQLLIPPPPPPKKTAARFTRVETLLFLSLSYDRRHTNRLGLSVRVLEVEKWWFLIQITLTEWLEDLGNNYAKSIKRIL